MVPRSISTINESRGLAAADIGKPVVKRSSGALLFESLNADFKLQALVNFAVLEVAELFVDVVDLGFEPVQRSCRLP